MTLVITYWAARRSHSRAQLYAAGGTIKPWQNGLAIAGDQISASTVLGGSVIDGAVQLVVATLSFWVIRLDALRWVVMSLENDFTRFPLTMYNRAVRIILGYVFPFAFMNYFPATVLLHKTADSAQFNPALGWFTPLVAAVWTLGALALCVGSRRASRGDQWP